MPDGGFMATMLVVDDDETVREALHDLFAENHLCHIAGTAEQAFAHLETNIYDVVLTDISMPGLSGLELLASIRQRWPNTPVIIISGINDHEYAQGFVKMGAFSYLVKPFRLEDVEDRVDKAIQHRQKLLEGR